MNNRIKYLHILSHPDVKFNPDFVRMINESNEFKTEEFLFITWHKNVYDAVKQYKNVFLLKNKNEMFKFLFRSKWIFMHANCFSKLQVILLPKCICKKIIWRTWGHDIRPLKNKKSIIKRLLFKLYVKKVNKFRAIGIANDIDTVNVQNVFGKKIDVFPINYKYRNNLKEKFDNIKAEMTKNKEIRILIGHNAGIAENHIENLQRLAKYSNENIKIILPLSYSNNNNEYVNKIKEESLKIFGKDKVEFLENFLEYFEYVKFLSNIDIAIMDQEFSNGLGNLSILIFFEKKIYVNKNGNIAQSFKDKGILANYTENIKNIDFEEFINNNFDEKMNEYIKYSSIMDEYASIKCMKNVIDNLR